MSQYQACKPSSNSSECREHHVHFMSHAEFGNKGPSPCLWEDTSPSLALSCCYLRGCKQILKKKTNPPDLFLAQEKNKTILTWEQIISLSPFAWVPVTSLYLLSLWCPNHSLQQSSAPSQVAATAQGRFVFWECLLLLQTDRKWMGWLKTNASKGLLEDSKRIFKNSENLIKPRVQIQTNAHIQKRPKLGMGPELLNEAHTGQTNYSVLSGLESN